MASSGYVKKSDVRSRRQCALCGSARLQTVISLPGYPLTGRFSKRKMGKRPAGINQRLLLCGQCGHVQLGSRISPRVLYDARYSFRTSASAKARAGTEFFLNFLKSVAPKRKFRSVLDVGCNDLYLLRRLAGKAKYRAGIDPIWEGKEKKAAGKGIVVIGGSVEGTDLNRMLPAPPDLVVCRHTLEHIDFPAVVLKKLLDAAADNALFVFEVPGFDTLFERLRFDQISHEHLQYFSLAVFTKLVQSLGGAVLGHRVNRHDWGALVIAFQKKKAPQGKGRMKGVPYRGNDIRKRYQTFCAHMAGVRKTLDLNKGKEICGYGAANMLPVLAYYLKSDMSFLKAVLDDDPQKKGWHYWNLPLAVRHSKGVDLSQVSVMITAVDNAQPILQKLLQNRPKDIVYPLPLV